MTENDLYQYQQKNKQNRVNSINWSAGETDSLSKYYLFLNKKYDEFKKLNILITETPNLM